MDAIKNLITDIPEWVTRLDQLTGQIDKRQEELALIVEGNSAGSDSSSLSRTKSIRNKGSTESLKPNDEIQDAEGQPAAVIQAAAEAEGETLPATTSPDEPLAHPDTEMTDAPNFEQQINQAKKAADTKARAAALRKRTVKIKKRSDSVVSAEGATSKQKYRTRSMIIVYYDKYVEQVFEDLVKFVSGSRNSMRKAKMAAKVAQIKRMAELEMAGAEEEEDAKNSPSPPGPPILSPDEAAVSSVPATTGPIAATGDIKIEASDAPPKQDELPKLNFVSTRNMRSPGMLASGRPTYSRANGRSSYLMGRARRDPNQPQDIYDELDKGLEYVQSMCEHAAHQFLRDGDCNEEIENMKSRLTETREIANRELERVKKEDPEALKIPDEPPKTRSYRPQSMRKDTSSSSSKEAKESLAKEIKEATPAPALDPSAPLEVDEGIEDMDVEPVKLVFKSTRRMR